MALKKCKECGQEVSTKADKCPYCGAKVKSGIGCLGAIGIFCLIGLFGSMFGETNNTTTKSSTSNVNTAAGQNATKEGNKFLYATERCQTYNEPNKGGGLFFYSPSAQKALTLDERELYEIIEEQGDWVQVDVFGKRPWVEKKCMTNQLTYKKNTLKKNALVCRTKEQFNEFIQNRNDKSYTMNMLEDGKCLFNITNAEVRAEVLEGIFPKVKVKVYWGDEIFVGWTETTMVNE